MNFCRFLFSVTILLTFPIECFVTREVVENVIFGQMGVKGERFNKQVSEKKTLRFGTME